jgi:hypothetical protein
MSRNYPRIWTAGGLALFAGRLAILYFCGEKVSNAVLSRGLGNIPNTSNTAMVQSDAVLSLGHRNTPNPSHTAMEVTPSSLPEKSCRHQIHHDKLNI